MSDTSEVRSDYERSVNELRSRLAAAEARAVVAEAQVQQVEKLCDAWENTTEVPPDIYSLVAVVFAEAVRAALAGEEGA